MLACSKQERDNHVFLCSNTFLAFEHQQHAGCRSVPNMKKKDLKRERHVDSQHGSGREHVKVLSSRKDVRIRACSFIQSWQ